MPGDTHRTPGHSRRIASASSGVRVTFPPLPELTPAFTVSLGSIWTTLAPIRAIVCWIARDEPLTDLDHRDDGGDADGDADAG